MNTHCLRCGDQIWSYEGYVKKLEAENKVLRDEKEKLQQELEQLKENTLKDFKDIQELKTIIKEMSDHSKGYAHCGMDMFAHTKWRKFAEILSLK